MSASIPPPPDEASLLHEDFGFPFEPYPVQRSLMAALYATMDSRQLGLFESPTGTGKTLSIICATLTWLRNNRLPTSSAAPTNPTSSTTLAAPDSDEPAWVSEQTAHRNLRTKEHVLHHRAAAYRRRVTAIARPVARQIRAPHKRRNPNPDDSLFSDSDSDSDSASKLTTPHAIGRRPGHHNSTTDRPAAAKVVFATRTHTQLAQFLSELSRTPFRPPTAHEADQTFNISKPSSTEPSAFDVDPSALPLSVVPFGSRNQLCVNDAVRALGSTTAVSERCRELTEHTSAVDDVDVAPRKRARATSRCEYHHREREDDLRDRALVGLHSIEELVDMGRELHACPYYATRGALDVGDVDVVGVPYSAVLHAPTREALGITIDENTVVVFDEAHNLASTVCELHSAVVTRANLLCVDTALQAYIARYESRFSASNLFKLRQLVSLCQGLLTLLPIVDAAGDATLETGGAGKGRVGERVVRPSQVIFEAGVDNINMYAVMSFMRESMLCKKLRGFVDNHEEKAITSVGNESTTSRRPAKRRPNGKGEPSAAQRSAKQSLAMFESFLRCLSDCAEHGRVAVYPRGEAHPADGEGVSRLEHSARLKYFVVDPGSLFSASVSHARSVLLLGGTLSPRAGLRTGLLGGLGREVREFECDHVVPARNVRARVCGRGPTGVELEFTFRRRGRTDGVDELGRAVERCVRSVSGGVVMFFASYDLLRGVLGRWRNSGQLMSLRGARPVFVEERGRDEAFEEFESAVRKNECGGAVLLAVMGGKLSEGINFSDELGRMVIVVGMPYANALQMETRERLQAVGGTREQAEFLENECMTVVNQSVGRAVRHRADFATIVLMDRRYERPRVMNKLPRFVKRDLSASRTFDALQRDLDEFYGRHC